MNTAALPAPSDTKTDLWRTLRHALVAAFDLFGDPASIARQGAALRRTHAPLLLWLRQCEALLRRLFYLDAVALAPSLPPVRIASRNARERVRRVHEQDPEDSAKWRVSFHVCASAPFDGRPHTRAVQGSATGNSSSTTQCLPEPHGLSAEALAKAEARVEGIAKSSTRSRFISTWPAAERFEALVRAFNNPAPHIRRLARLLQRRTACATQFRVAPPRRYGDCPLEEEIAAATDLAHSIDRDTS